MGPLALRVTATCIFTCTMISTLTGGCRAEHVPRACDSCDSKQRSRQQHGGRRRAQHIRIACANCCTRLNTASVRRTPYRPAPPPSAKGATWASIRLHRSVPEADRLLSGKRCSAGRRLDLLACLQGGLGGPGRGALAWPSWMYCQKAAPLISPPRLAPCARASGRRRGGSTTVDHAHACGARAPSLQAGGACAPPAQPSTRRGRRLRAPAAPLGCLP